MKEKPIDSFEYTGLPMNHSRFGVLTTIVHCLSVVEIFRTKSNIQHHL